MGLICHSQKKYYRTMVGKSRISAVVVLRSTLALTQHLMLRPALLHGSLSWGRPPSSSPRDHHPAAPPRSPPPSSLRLTAVPLPPTPLPPWNPLHFCCHRSNSPHNGRRGRERGEKERDMRKKGRIKRGWHVNPIIFLLWMINGFHIFF